MRLQGLEAFSLQWGAWAGVGMAASDASLLTKLRRQGYGVIQPVAGLKALHGVLISDHPESSSNLLLSPFDWATYLRGTATLCDVQLFLRILGFRSIMQLPLQKGDPVWALYLRNYHDLHECQKKCFQS